MSKSIFRKKSVAKILNDVECGFSDSEHPGTTSSQLKKELNVKDLTLMGIAAVVGAGIFSTRAATMSAHSLGSGGEITRWSRAAHHTLFNGPGYNPQMPSSETSAASFGKHARRVRATQGCATHTDPQLLFSAATS